MLRPLGEIPSGSRVRKPSAIVFDFAYRRTGTVVRERLEDGREHLGVVWDGSGAVYEYPGETEFEVD